MKFENKKFIFSLQEYSEEKYLFSPQVYLTSIKQNREELFQCLLKLDIKVQYH